MEGIQADTKVGVVGCLDELPAVPVGIHIGTPRQGLIGDEHIVAFGQLGGPVQLIGDDFVVVHRGGGNIGRYQDHVHAQVLHELELDRKSTRLNSSHVAISY